LIQQVAERRRIEIEEWKRKLTDPQTLYEFETFISYRGQNALTSEQQVRYEALVAESGQQQRFRDKARKASSYSIELSEAVTLSEVIETRHTREGYDLFVVQLSDRPTGVATRMVAIDKR
jgi:hypothetical protein